MSHHRIAAFDDEQILRDERSHHKTAVPTREFVNTLSQSFFLPIAMCQPRPLPVRRSTPTLTPPPREELVQEGASDVPPTTCLEMLTAEGSPASPVLRREELIEGGAFEVARSLREIAPYCASVAKHLSLPSLRLGPSSSMAPSLQPI